MPVHPIFALILCGNLVEVATLIRSDPNVIKQRKSDSKNASPLHWAVRKKQKKISKKLLQVGADVHNKDDDGSTPLHFAAQEGDSEIATLLIEHGANVNCVDKSGSTPAHEAARNGHKTVLEVLVTHGADINVQDKCGYAPLHHSAQNGHHQTVKFMLDKTNVDTSVRDAQLGFTALHRAALYGHSACTELLVQHSPHLVNSKSFAGNRTPLLYASFLGDKKTYVSILQKKPTLAFDDDGTSPLHALTRRDHYKIVEMLVLEYGWDPNIVSSIFYASQNIDILI